MLQARWVYPGRLLDEGAQASSVSILKASGVEQLEA